MKALSLTQPWAAAICMGVKKWETRSWSTSFRGEVAIHAAKGFPKWAREFAEEKGYSNLALGKIVCVCDLTDCRKTEDIVGSLDEVEQSWGDYGEGRYAFKLENVRLIAEPIAVKGALGFWYVPPDISIALRVAIQ